MAAPRHTEGMTVELLVKLAIAVVVAGVVVGILMPKYARAWIRANWAKLLELVALSAILGVLVHYTKLAPKTWLRVTTAIVASGGMLWVIFRQRIYRDWFKFLTIDQWRAIDAESDREGRAGNFDWRVLVILVAAAVSLTLQEYLGDRGQFERWFTTSSKASRGGQAGACSAT
jgi:hypothetical protein